MDYLEVKYKLTHDALAERCLLVKHHQLEEEDEQVGKSLWVTNVPFFMEEPQLRVIFSKCDSIELLDTKGLSPIRTRNAIIRYDSKVKLEKEVRLFKHSIETIVICDTNVELAKDVLLERCGLALLEKEYVNYPENIDEIRAEVMEVARKYRDEIRVEHKKKKRRYEREDDGWVTVVRK